MTHSNQLCGCVRKYPERLFVNVVVLGMLLIVGQWTKCNGNKEKWCHNLLTNTSVLHCVYQITYQLQLWCVLAFIVTIIRQPCLTVNLQLDWDTLGSLMMVAMNAEGQQSS